MKCFIRIIYVPVRECTSVMMRTISTLKYIGVAALTSLLLTFLLLFFRNVPVIYVVTPTGVRLAQVADLTRLSYTLGHVPDLHWIVVEDGEVRSTRVAQVLQLSKVHYTHLNIPTPPNIKQTRGMPQRNLGLDWLHRHAQGPGVVYFADDDNTYDLRLFEEIRKTKKVSVWPVAFVAGLQYEAPIYKDGKVTGWYTTFERKFGIDMAGFAINIDVLRRRPEVRFTNTMGMMETGLLTNLKLELDDLEPGAQNCTQILVWHTRTEKPSTQNERRLHEKFRNNTILLDV